MNKIFDAHMHLNLQSDHPASDFANQVRNHSLTGANLILNSENEIAFFEENTALIIESLKYSVVSYVLNWKINSIKIDLSNTAYRTAIKLHPRLQNIKVSDFDEIKDALKIIKADIVIVDAFVNGHTLQNHIGTELAIFLAFSFPEKKIIVAHMGGHKALDCVMLTKTLDNIYHDLSFTINFFEDASVAQDLIFLCKKYNKRIMYGSDYPFCSVQDSLRCMERYFDKADFSVAERNNILYDNAFRVFMGEEA